jgi:aspartate 1-decarboxylase
LCKSKIKNAIITGKNLKYDGSIGIDKKIIVSADMVQGEQVHVLNTMNGERFTTYIIEEPAGSGNIILYGPAARLGEPGDEVVILTYCHIEAKEIHNFNMRVISLGKNNQCKTK